MSVVIKSDPDAIVLYEWEAVSNRGQKWLLCDFEWGIEEYVTLTTREGDKLILCNIEEFSGVDSRGGRIGGIRTVPVKAKDLERWVP